MTRRPEADTIIAIVALVLIALFVGGVALGVWR